MPVVVLVRFGRNCGGFAVAVLQLGKLLLVLFAEFWTLLLESLADSPLAVFASVSEAFGEVPSSSSSTSDGYFS